MLSVLLGHFLDIAFCKLGAPDFCRLRFVDAGSARGELGQARPSCELGTPTHADAGALTPLRAGNLHPCFVTFAF